MFNNFHDHPLDSTTTFNNNGGGLNLKTHYEMAPLDSCVTFGSTSSSSSSPDQIMSPFLTGSGYMPFLPEFNQVAPYLPGFPPINPADHSTWVGGLIPGMNSQTGSAPLLPEYPTDPVVTPLPTAWNDCRSLPMVFQATNQEDSGIELVHALIDCAESVQRGNLVLAGTLVKKLQALLTLVNVSSGIGKVAGFFIEALSRRIYSAQGIGSVPMISPADDDSSYHGFYEATPYLKFAHFTANQAILEAFNGRDCVHVIDFSLMQGLQWPVLIQALALLPGGAPMLRITGVGPHSLDGRDSLINEVGLKLAELAGSVNVQFEFRAVAVSRLDEIKPEMLDVRPGEAVAVNCIFQLHKLLGSDPVNGSSIKSVLSWVRGLNPTIVTVVEQEADHNQLGFLDRFTGALFYYSTIFDSLETCSAQGVKSLADKYLEREIVDVVCFEDSARVERHEPLTKWRARLSEAGFKPVDIGLNAFTQANMLLTLFSAYGYCVEENDGCLRLGWHSRPLVAASAWQPILDDQMGI